jgi:homospermidine synthase
VPHGQPTRNNAAFPKPIVILGFGSIGQAVLPLLLRHIEVQPSQVTIIAKDEDGIEIAKKYGIRHVKETLTKKNYEAALDPYLGRAASS